MSWIAPRLIAESLSRPTLYPKSAKPGEERFPWQYHSRSDDHSKIAAIGVALDLLGASAELCDAADRGLIGYQVNPVMVDRTNRKKTLDLGLGLINEERPHPRGRSLEWLLEEYGATLTEDERTLVSKLPPVREAYFKHPLIVLENKACMTAHGKAAPRLRNELEGAVEAINRSNQKTVAGGLVIVNAAPTFVSPVYRDNGYVPPESRRPTFHNQPEDAIASVEKLKRIPLRSRDSDDGYDALGIVVVSAANDGTPCELLNDADYGMPPEDIYNYSEFMNALTTQYRQRFNL